MPRKPAKRPRTEVRVHCEQCDASYTRLDKLDKHIAKHHPATASQESDNDPDNEIPNAKILYRPEYDRLRPFHPSQVHFACAEQDCMLGQLISTMIPFECDHMKEQRLDQLQKWLNYVRANNRRSVSLVLGDRTGAN